METTRLTQKKYFVNIKGLGLTETLGFNRNFIHPLFNEIEVVDVEQNPKAKRVKFISIKDKKILKDLIDSTFNEKISNEYIKHNRFAIYNYQIIEK